MAYQINVKSLIHILLGCYIVFNFIDRDISYIFLLPCLFLCLSFVSIKQMSLTIITKKVLYINIFFLTYLVALTLYHNNSISTIDNYSRLLILFPILAYLSEYKISKKFFEYVLLISTAAMSLLYIYDIYFLDIKYPGWSGRYYGTSNNPISYGNIVMTLGIICLSTFAYNLQRKIVSTYILLSFFICFFIWSETEARGSIIGLLLSIIALLYLTPIIRKKMYLTLFFILPFLFVPNISNLIKDTYNSISDTNFSVIESSINKNHSINERKYFIYYSIKSIMDNPVTGVSSDDFYNNMSKDIKKRNINIVASKDAHNEFLDIFAKYGLMGLFLFLFIFIYILYIFVIHRNDYFSYIGVFTLISQLGFMLTKSQFASQQSTVFFIMLLYICLSSLNKGTQEK